MSNIVFAVHYASTKLVCAYNVKLQMVALATAKLNLDAQAQVQVLIEREEAAADAARESGDKAAFDRHYRLAHSWRANPQTAYKYLAGEVEARNTQARQGMTAETVKGLLRRLPRTCPTTTLL